VKRITASPSNHEPREMEMSFILIHVACSAE
jgi:hypothetical protein